MNRLSDLQAWVVTFATIGAAALVLLLTAAFSPRMVTPTAYLDLDAIEDATFAGGNLSIRYWNGDVEVLPDAYEQPLIALLTQQAAKRMPNGIVRVAPNRIVNLENTRWGTLNQGTGQASVRWASGGIEVFTTAATDSILAKRRGFLGRIER